ncbi:helix-turn-helix domain-containing protein [Capnocytophaga sp.]|uniref:helix-turn-helix domain-containing protein n=1 Tax=Capnocytophaga sp. TaxID=44737 RepID=UPI0026DD7D9D|nr:helix-turn-helix domain-containing protein [Capnocytophaga sp.]MDO5106407.1 helix-turn-helix domain-containing protein [Capnocytophaga sp.]
MDKHSIIVTQIEGLSITALQNEFNKIHAQLLELKKNSNPEPQQLLTRHEVAKLLGVSLVTVHNWTKANIIKAYRIGNQVRYKRAEILNALQSINTK